MIFDAAWEEMVASGGLAGISVRHLGEAGSTNDVATGLAKEGAADYTVVVADSQTEGRGRLGKRWLSPPGTGLYFSIILRPVLSPEDLPKITLVAGLAVALAVEKIIGIPLKLKWPNDLLLDSKKLGGILAETVNVQGQPTVVVLGVGMNANTPLAAFPGDLQEKVTSLLITTGREYRRSDLLISIVRELKSQIGRFEQSGFRDILNDWRKLDATYGRELSWVAREGRVVRGVSLGPDDSGQLLIRDSEGKIHEVLSGDLSLAGE